MKVAYHMHMNRSNIFCPYINVNTFYVNIILLKRATLLANEFRVIIKWLHFLLI